MIKHVWIFCLSLVLFGRMAFADTQSEYVAHTRVEIFSDVQEVKPGEPFNLGVRFKMHDGWHIYWKNPGDSGLAPSIHWTKRPGLVIGPIQWPMAQRIVAGPLTSYGYENEVSLIVPAQITDTPQDAKSLVIEAKIDWLACQVDCIPGTVTRTLELKVNLQMSVANAEGRSIVNRESRRWPLNAPSYVVTASDRNDSIELVINNISSALAKAEFYFFPDRSDLIDHAAHQEKQLEGQVLHLIIPKSTIAQTGSVERLQGDLVSSLPWADTGQRGLRVDGPLTHAAISKKVDRQSALTLPIACLFALIGGLILNLMPCVFPVLSLKILSVMKYSHNRQRMIVHGVFYSVGIITSFWILAAILIVLKIAGHQIGWGFQFQSSYFVVFMAGILFIFALNLLGVFEFSSLGWARSSTERNSYWESFMSGVFATTLATPCTAPFMGTALGYALGQSNQTALLIFTCLGLGMAIPFLALSVSPQLLGWIPKPGRWMIHLRGLLGFLLLGAVVWLVWVLGLQKGINSLGLFLCGLVFMSLAGWLYGLIENESSSRLKFFWLIVTIVIALSLWISSAMMRWEGSSGSADHSVNAVSWQPFSQQKLDQWLSEQKPVFIDFTAAWCLTCQVNDRLVLNQSQVMKAFRERKIQLLKADWTNRDPQITDALQRYGKNSIPLYVFYPQGSTEPVVLPELITPEIILKAISSNGQKD